MNWERGVLKSKRRWCIKGVCILLVFLLLATAIPINILSEDIDGDGLPNLVETQIGTNPYDPMSCVYVAGISDISNVTIEAVG